jgi:hypothetical protein
MSLDRGSIERQLKQIGEGDHWWEHREFRELHHVLYADERINGLVQGRLLVGRRPRLRPARRWLIVATDQRLICLRHERFGRKQIDIAAAVITRIDQRSRFRGSQITVATATRTYRMRMSREDAFRFARALEPLVPATPVPHVRRGLLDPISAIALVPGFDRLVGGVTMLPPPDAVTRADLERVEVAVDRIQVELDRLQEQVAFLEKLLHQRTETAAAQVPRSVS